ncbi:MAG TPA: hypothetical protein PKM72_01000 [Nitrospirales bacterium]|nr:hypothetical protein [Nitrospirales bacterium]
MKPKAEALLLTGYFLFLISQTTASPAPLIVILKEAKDLCPVRREHGFV